MMCYLKMEASGRNVVMPTYLYNKLKSTGIRYTIDFESTCLVFYNEEDYNTAKDILENGFEPHEYEKPKVEKTLRGKLF